jgi:ketosteroid isomerase-like protein
MSAEQHRELIRRLYDGLDRADGEAMAACYAPDATFSDPVFTGLAPGRVRDMWRMLCECSTDLDAELVEHDADEARGTAA